MRGNRRTHWTDPIKYKILDPIARQLSRYFWTGPRRVPARRIIFWPGHYRLDRDLTVEDSIGIRIACGNVVLDLAGHSITHARGPTAGSFGIRAAAMGRITIQNGTIDGFWHGVHVTGTSGSKIIGNTVCNTGYLGIHLCGSESEISGNSVRDQRLDLLRDTDKYVVGILVGGTNVTVQSNLIENGALYESCAPDIEIVGILASAETRSTDIKGNRIRYATYLPRSRGVWVAEDTHTRVMGNNIKNVEFGVTSGSPHVEVIDNVLCNDLLNDKSIGVAVPISNGSTIIRGNAIKSFERAVYAPGATSGDNKEES